MNPYDLTLLACQLVGFSGPKLQLGHLGARDNPQPDPRRGPKRTKVLNMLFTTLGPQNHEKLVLHPQNMGKLQPLKMKET